jgi:hypothetical protein
MASVSHVPVRWQGVCHVYEAMLRYGLRPA